MTHTLQITPKSEPILRELCGQYGLTVHELPYTLFAYKSKGLSIALYTSFKLVVQGEAARGFLERFLQKTERLDAPEYQSHVGMDESGKGDLFGPMVTACVYAESESIREWRLQGVKDSKDLSDGEVFRMEKMIKSCACVYHVCTTGMDEYNHMIGKTRDNMNNLLIWQHKRALAQVVFKVGKPIKYGIVDKFANRELLQQHFYHPGLELDIHYHAEADPVVAAASILARAEHLRQFKSLSEKAGFVLQRGVNEVAKEQAVRLLNEGGLSYLSQFAKLNFKTVGELTGQVRIT